jgi:SulP family sulfate permease
VTTGFTSGIAVVIAGLQLKDVFGLRTGPLPEHFPERLLAYWQARGTLRWSEFVVAALTLALLLVPRLPKRLLARLPRMLKRVPAPLVALPLAALLAFAFKRWGLDVETLGDRFQTMVDGTLIRGVPQRLPELHLPWLNADGSLVSLATLRRLLPSVLTITVLAAIESLLSAVVADGMIRTRHNPNAELLGLGIANMVAPFFGGIPATGAIARTATNFRYGGRSPVASMVHALTVLAALLLLAPLLSYLPMAGLAALLLLVAWNMSEIDHFRHVLKHGPRSDVLVLLTCFSLTILFDMALAVMAGTLLAALFLIRKIADSAGGQVLEFHESLPAPLPKDVALYHMEGPLFFGSAERAIGAIRTIGQEVRAVIFDLRNVPQADISGYVALESMLEELQHLEIKAVFAGARPSLRHFLEKAGLREEKGRLIWCHNLTEAYRHLQIRLPTLRRRPGKIRFHPLRRARQAGKKARKQAG